LILLIFYIYYRFHIEAVTLEGIRRKKTGKISLAVTGRYVILIPVL
jgi:hypothetical protein